MDKIPQIYFLCARAFNYPEPGFWERNGKNLLAFWKDSGLSASSRRDFYSSSPGFFEKLKGDYLHYFELGYHGTPSCPLYEGLHRKDIDRMSLILELLRFYHFFDLTLSQAQRDYPDHLSTELEFMGYLASCELEASRVEGEARPFQLAQRDFLQRHLGVWMPLFKGRLEQHMKDSLYNQLCLGLAQLIKEEENRLEASLKGGHHELEEN